MNEVPKGEKRTRGLPCGPGRPAWIEVDPDAIAANVAAVRRRVGPEVEVMAVVKANAYGHGLLPAARAALRGGASALGVALLEEGLELRESGVSAPVLVLGCGLPEQADTLVAAGLSQTVSDVSILRALDRAARARGRPARVHLKIDTGMGRVGVAPEQAGAMRGEIARLPGLVLEGISTHVAWEEAADMARAEAQIDRFEACRGIRPPSAPEPRWVHAANSVLTVRMPRAHFDMVRVGLLTYGIAPTGGPDGLDLRPALCLKARITQVRPALPGQTVGYGGTFTVRRPSRLALVPLGYADGYSRGLSNRGRVLLRGRDCPVVGSVCMDQMVVDVTGVPDVCPGEEVVLLGRSGGREISVGDLAQAAGSIPHEIVAQLGARLPRIRAPHPESAAV